jgi:hypothetical protein
LRLCRCRWFSSAHQAHSRCISLLPTIS